MILYLSSQKFGTDTTFLKEWIIEHGNKILLIFNALDAKGQEKIDNNVNDDISLLEQIGFKVKVLDLKDYFDNQEKLKKICLGYNSFCVMGGNVFVLRQAMKYSGFDTILEEKKNIFMSGLISKKTGKRYDADLCLETDEAGNASYHLEFSKEK